jgi:hypothetical protein
MDINYDKTLQKKFLKQIKKNNIFKAYLNDFNALMTMNGFISIQIFENLDTEIK